MSNDANEIFTTHSFEGLLFVLGLPPTASVADAVDEMEDRHPEVEGAEQWASYLCRSDLGVLR